MSDKTDSWEDSREQICWYRGRAGAIDSNMVDVVGRKTLQRQWDASEVESEAHRTLTGKVTNTPPNL